MIVRALFRAALVTCVALGLAGLALDGSAAAAAQGGTVLVGSINGTIDPVAARYVDRVISDGEQQDARAVVLTIDTPGGDLLSTSDITTRMLNARVPVITFVYPSGSRAASAGTFITLAGNVAAMAPLTNIGAAHPVGSNGQDLQGDERTKAVNDAVAQIRNIATARGHNPEWAEQAVRNSVSITADEAVSMHVADLEASDVPDLLRKVDGREVSLPQGKVTLRTAGATIVDDQPSPFEQVLKLLTDPTVAIMLFSVGTYGLIFELANPGLIFPGVIGVVAILLALLSFGTLDANAAGMGLLLFAVLLFLSEIWVPSHGILTAGGIISTIIGAVILFPPGRPTLPGGEVGVPPSTIAVIAGISGVFFFFLARVGLRYHGLRPIADTSALVGAVGIAKSDVDPAGVVHVGNEDWSARSEAGGIHIGDKVTVRAVEGIRLVVTRAPEGKEGS
ncbi:MAG: nodulation protein NfeD [Chloroflexota bacterium]|nr:nodulation protein NfeD [Chloroflexota bacterium]